MALNQDGVARSAADLLALPGVDVARLAAIWPALAAIAPEAARQAEIDALYRGYLERQDDDVRAYRADEALELPADLDYAALAQLSHEARLKLGQHRPRTLGQAARISGVTPAALVLLLRHVRRRVAA